MAKKQSNVDETVDAGVAAAPGANVVEEGVDRSRTAGVIPDSAMLGSGKPRTAKPKVAVRPPPEPEPEPEPEQEPEPEESSEDVGGAEDQAGGDDGDADPAQVGQATDEKPQEMSEDELIDLLLDAGIEPPKPGETRAAAQTTEKPGGDELQPEFKAEYDAAVDKYGEELADTLLKPRLLAEQRLRAMITPVLQERAAQQQRQASEAAGKIMGFFKEKSAQGFAAIYGADLNSATPIQTEAARRVISRAIDIRNRVEAAGFQMTPEKALERAHAEVWANTKIGRAVAAKAGVAARRAASVTVPSRGGGNASTEGGGGGDKYAKVRARLVKEGITRR